jgi:hypothetical protein
MTKAASAFAQHGVKRFRIAFVQRYDLRKRLRVSLRHRMCREG